ncbi:hypothetical protein ACJMK2_014185 [Sinanodonta woodiana]|uniref:Uncharacterized protein n=1 Tax=Sinanodonta woodiana TaxID=1069815 RepID=A0ABD3V349_SINWO
MTSLNCLVVAIGVVSVQATSIFRHLMSDALERITENDHRNFDGRNDMITDLVRNQFHVLLEKNASPSFTCMHEACKFCEYGFCFIAAYQSESDNFLVEGTFLGESAFRTTFNVKPWRDCASVDLILSVEVCKTIHKLRIMNGRICADLDVESGHLFNTKFTELCI